MTATDSRTRATGLTDRFQTSRQLTESLAEVLTPEDQTIQSMPDASPTKWHRAHTTWFYETFVLADALAGYEPFDHRYSYLFNSYYEAVGERHPRAQRGLVSRPGTAQIGEYRRAIDEAMARLLVAIDAGRADESWLPLIELGINHEQQHQELLLMDAKHVLSANTFDSCYVDPTDAGSGSQESDPGPMGWLQRDGGLVAVGVADPDAFHFDNEAPRHQVLVSPHHLADRLVTCGEWMAFINDGGYTEPRLWLSDGWYTRMSEQWQAPLYWSNDNDRDHWEHHTMVGSRPVDPAEPVCHVSFYEADAFATWAGARLPTEFEWEAAAADEDPADPAANLLADAGGTGTALEINRFHPDIAEAPTGRPRQLIGDCWEWTGSPNRPYPGYQVPDGAIGEYNGKFMINTMVLRGGSAFTPSGHLRTSYRNFFHPHTRWHLSGVRLAKD